MATPHVSGIGALLISRGWTSQQSRTLIDTTALDLGDPGDDDYFGYGRVDAAAAVNGTPAEPPPPPPPPPPPENPVVSITNPTNGTVKRGSRITIQANATDNVAVAQVEFYVNATLACSTQTSPYSCGWKVPSAPNRVYQLRAIAVDAAGNKGVSQDVFITAK